MKKPDEGGWEKIVANKPLKNSYEQGWNTKKPNNKDNKKKKKEKAKEKPSKNNNKDVKEPDIEVPNNNNNKSGGEKQRISVPGTKKEIEIERPPKVLLLIWILVAAELLLDLVTSGIAFTAFLREPGICCDEPINTGATPLGATIPFFFLVIAELIFLFKAIKLTLWPNGTTSSMEEEEQQEPLRKRICHVSKWSPKFIMWIVNFMTVINPFFGLVIAWMLMYQSDKDEALTVMILEAVTIVLHFASVYIEKSAQTWKMKLIHGSVLLPWLATLSINLWYLNQGGVCYDTSLQTFWYRGCEICDDGEPLINGTMCAIGVDENNETIYDTPPIWELESNSTCEENITKVCWFPYDG